MASDSVHNTETAVFAAGCFWGVEEAFRTIPGVLETEAGYTGGQTADPTYEEVCTGATGHAEAVKVTFNPSVVSYEELVRTFFRIHNPTTKDRQGPDTGNQYRSAIFTTSDVQRDSAARIRDELDAQTTYKHPIVTDIADAGQWYRAEEYHQKYALKNGGAACHFSQNV